MASRSVILARSSCGGIWRTLGHTSWLSIIFDHLTVHNEWRGRRLVTVSYQECRLPSCFSCCANNINLPYRGHRRPQTPSFPNLPFLSSTLAFLVDPRLIKILIYPNFFHPEPCSATLDNLRSNRTLPPLPTLSLSLSWLDRSASSSIMIRHGIANLGRRDAEGFNGQTDDSVTAIQMERLSVYWDVNGISK